MPKHSAALKSYGHALWEEHNDAMLRGELEPGADFTEAARRSYRERRARERE